MMKAIATPPGEGTHYIEMTADEAKAFQADQSAMATRQAADNLVSAGQKALTRSDLTALRCIKANVPFPDEWLKYVTALRAIVDGGPGPLPVQPDYPKNT